MFEVKFEFCFNESEPILYECVTSASNPMGAIEEVLKLVAEGIEFVSLSLVDED